jgi:predicted TIM-barrel fold metal-dependent hydrolase
MFFLIVIPKEIIMVISFDIRDAHTHLFSYQFFKALFKVRTELKQDADATIDAALVKEKLGIEIPPENPVALAERWIGEMDKYGVRQVVTFGSIPGEEESIAQVAKRFPERFVGYFVVNPKLSNASDVARRALSDLGMRGILLFPAMFHFHVYENALTPIYKLAQKYHAPVFIHCGVLKIKLRDVLGLPYTFDGTYANPTDVHRIAIKFPNINFIIPHFGAGYFRETLMLGNQCKNVYVDTSSSNEWIHFQSSTITLQEVFQKALYAFGVERMLFGTDSNTFPRGYRHDILHQQLDILRSLQLSDDAIGMIMGGNLKRILS